MSNWRIRLGPVITPFFRVWWRFRRPMTLGVRVLVIDSEGRVLLVRHTYTHGWHLPGGGVERGETAMDALLRELAEEAGVAPLSPPLLAGFYANHANFPNDHIALYRVEAWREVPHASAGEIAERGFFPADALPDETTPGTRRRIAEAFFGAATVGEW